jgi:uncharacterized protein (TIGR00255 family)
VTSMTGFGHGELQGARGRMTLEIRSYNNRYLDLFLNLPFNLKVLEPRIREYLSARIQRGKIELYLSVSDIEEDLAVSVDPDRVRMYVDAVNALKRIAGIRERTRLSHLAGMEGIFKTESKRDPETLWTLLLPLLEKVFVEFRDSRAAEGKKTEEDIRKLAELIRGHISAVEAAIPAIQAKILQTLRDRFTELLGDGVDETRILAETAVQLVRLDINEEIQRMKSHLESLFDAIGKEGSHGKRLDFVCQELGREINTIGSKSMMLEIDKAVIGVKDALEKIREQLRNVE